MTLPLDVAEATRQAVALCSSLQFLKKFQQVVSEDFLPPMERVLLKEQEFLPQVERKPRIQNLFVAFPPPHALASLERNPVVCWADTNHLSRLRLSAVCAEEMGPGLARSSSNGITRPLEWGRAPWMELSGEGGRV